MAPDERSATERLKNSVIPLKVLSVEQGTKRPLSVSFSVRKQKDQVLTFTTELSALLGAGLPLDRSLNILGEISPDREMKRVISEILRSIREGGAFSDALQKHPALFSTIYVNMVRSGEAGSVLDAVLDQLNEFLESAKELKETVISAMIYPSVLVLTGGISIIVLMTYILPRFSVIFDELGGSLPLATRLLLAISTFLSSYWWLFLLAIIGLAISLRTHPDGPGTERRNHDHHHERHGSSGRLWQGRFKAFPIEEDAHLLTVMRYVERNALMSGLVERAEQWPWGSLAWRQDDVTDLLTRPPLRMPSDWARFVNEPQTPQELNALRECATRQRPFGDDAWARRTAGAHGQEWTLRTRGRPRKSMPATAPNPTQDLPLGCEK